MKFYYRFDKPPIEKWIAYKCGEFGDCYVKFKSTNIKLHSEKRFFIFITPILIYKIKNILEFNIVDSVIFYGLYTLNIGLLFLSCNKYNQTKSKTGINFRLDKISR